MRRVIVIADYRFGGKQGHGPAWQRMMALCGYTQPQRCHAVDNEAIRQRRELRRVEVRGRCGCADGVMLGPVQPGDCGAAMPIAAASVANRLRCLDEPEA